MKKFIFALIFSSFFLANFSQAEELKNIIWKVDYQHLQTIKDWNIVAFNELTEQSQVSEVEFIKKFQKINNLMIRDTNIMPLSICVFSNVLIIKPADNLNCD